MVTGGEGLTDKVSGGRTTGNPMFLAFSQALCKLAVWDLGLGAGGEMLQFHEGPFAADDHCVPGTGLLGGLELLADLGDLEGQFHAEALIAKSLQHAESFRTLSLIDQNDGHIAAAMGFQPLIERGGSGGMFADVV